MFHQPTGLAEKDVALRILSTGATLLVLLAIFLGFFWMILRWSWWIAVPVGLALTAIGFFVVLKVVDHILPKKVRAPWSHHRPD
jgi:hypothetical protein